MSKCLSDPKAIAGLALRVGFGVSLALVGLSHYMGIAMFTGMVAGNLGPLTSIGQIWAYILPGLQIVGGVLIATGVQVRIGAWAAGIALVSIAIGMLLKSVLGGAGLTEVMPAVQNTLIWLIIYFFAVKSACCCCKSGSCSTEAK